MFIEPALERAAAAREVKKPKTITLSPLEKAFATAVTKDFSTEAMKQYRTIAKISDTVGSPAFNRRLVQQGLLKQENGQSTPTGFGLLLFGKEPRIVMPQAGLLGTIHYADGTEEPKDFDGPMLSRNPVLHYVFARMELAEERGLGLKSMRGRAEAAGLPLPRFAWEAPYLVLTFYRSAAGAVRDLSREVLDHLNADEKASWQFIVGRESVTSPVLMKEMGFDERKAQRVLKALLDSGLLRRVGRGPATRYEVVRP